MAEKDGKSSQQHKPPSNAHYLRSSSSSSIFRNPWFLLSTVTLAFLLFFALLPLLNFLTTIPRPKNTWISLNDFLLLIAIISGALSNHNDDDDGSISASQQIEFPSSFSFLDHPIHQDPVRIAEMETRNDPSRFSDDIHVNCTSRRRTERHRHCRRHRRKEEEASGSRDIQIEKLVALLAEDRSSLPPPPPVVKKKAGGTLPRKGRNEDLEKLEHPPPSSEKKNGGTKGVAHLYKKKQRNKHNDDIALRSPPPSRSNSVFYNLFKKSSKRESVHSLTHPPPPPLHPKKKALRPPSPATESLSDGEDDHGLDIGSESPLNPLPPPPPPPPFELQKLKFPVHGDFVPVSSGLSDSSDTENVEIPILGRKESSPLLQSNFCSSPQVDTRADEFIASFHES